jgi:tagatose-1,6-bisphosphate aldolase
MKISSLQSPEGMFNLIEFSDEAKFIEALGLDSNDQGSKEIITKILSAQFKVYSGQDSENFEGVSGFILDPEISLKAFASHTIDIALGLNLDEPQAEYDPLSLPRLVNEWGVEQIRNNYSVAVLTLYYHPEEEAALKKKQFLAEIKDYCQYEGIDLIVKLVVYTPGDRVFEWNEFRKDQLQAIEELRNLADLFVLQYPKDSLACATITTQLDVPWLISDDNIDYNQFKERLRDALENGASGFMAGETLFKEIEGMRKSDHSPDLENILKFITSQARDRAIELVRISKEFSQ